MGTLRGNRIRRRGPGLYRVHSTKRSHATWQMGVKAEGPEYMDISDGGFVSIEGIECSSNCRTTMWASTELNKGREKGRREALAKYCSRNRNRSLGTDFEISLPRERRR